MRTELKAFYSNLYRRRSTKTEQDCLEFLRSINTPRLVESEKQLCEGKLAVKDSWEALSAMKSNKSPGNDGITKEFYQHFLSDFRNFLVATLNYTFDKGELLVSQKQVAITLIEKKDRDKCFIKNWRPISLLDVDVKIASKALANRVKKVIPKLIAVDQTAYVKGRFIGESIRVINELIEHIKREGDEGILFSTDTEKAFDSVDHTFLFSTLEKFGSGFDFIKWIKTLPFNNQSCVMNNGYATGYFDLERGTRQRDPLSAYLFILVFEILLIQIRQDNVVTGFIVDGSGVKLTCFADD